MKKLLPLLFLLSCSVAAAQDTIRVCTYNVLNFSQTNEDGRTSKYMRILREIKPDILLAQEIVDQPSALALAQSLLVGINADKVGLSGFNDGEDTDNMLYFNIKKLEMAAVPVYHKTALRDIAEYSLKVVSTGEILHIFSMHLKAGDTQEDEIQRTSEIQVLKQNMPMGGEDNVIIAGDMNFYSPDEVPYTMLTNTPFQRMTDPLGTWERSSTQYLRYYTQSPRYVANAACGGGTGGGMDDRFDFILHSDALGDNVVTGSYTTFGNDGADRRNAPINSPVNTAVSAGIADDLFCASDHLPVYEDFIFSAPTSVEENLLKEISFKETSDNISISLPSPGSVTVVDILGRILLKENVDGRWDFKKTELPTGMYFIQVQSGQTSGQYKLMVTQ